MPVNSSAIPPIRITSGVFGIPDVPSVLLDQRRRSVEYEMIPRMKNGMPSTPSA